VPESVGFVGLGAMGERMAARLVAAGHPVVVWTRSGRTLVGALSASTPADLAARVDLVAGCLLDDAAVEAVYLGDDGLLAGAARGTVLLEHGTFSPALARRVGDEAAGRGLAFLDAPVTGGPEGAADGTLVTMVGGDIGALGRHRATIAAYLGAVEHVGPLGAGLALKLVNQHLVSVHLGAAAEAAALLAAAGIAADRALAVLMGGWASSAMLERELPRALSGDFTSAGATIGGLIHVQELIARAFAESGLESRLLPVVRELFADAVARGLADADPAALTSLYGPGGTT
jgi:3-hydroxyisobutyrate dehydrogenase-like beta-hydroxyacid dehydrogenase